VNKLHQTKRIDGFDYFCFESYIPLFLHVFSIYIRLSELKLFLADALLILGDYPRLI
jgi:hypothetical protein